MTWLMVRYSLSNGHIRPGMERYAVAAASWRNLSLPVIFLISAPVALLSAGAAFALWLLSAVPWVRATPAPAEDA
jgi:hypothetical protein